MTRKKSKNKPKATTPQRVDAPASAAPQTKSAGGSQNLQAIDLFRYGQGVPVFTSGTANRYNKVRHYKGWVYVAIRAIAEKISQLRPVVGIKRKITGKSKFLTKSLRGRLKSTTMIAEHEDIEPADEGHPLGLLLDDPNDPDTSADLWYRTLLFWELSGIAYWWLPRNNAGMPTEIWVLPSHWVTPIGGVDRLIGSYRITPYEGSYNTVEIDADDVISIKHPSPVSLVDGYASLDGGSAWVDQADSMDAARWFQMNNAHNAGMVLQLQGSMQAPSKEDLDAAYGMLAQRMQGPSKSRLPLILPPGWESGGKYGMGAEELDFTNSFDQIRDMVLALFRVPKGVLGIEPGVANTSAYAPLQQFYEYCINPKLQYMGQVLTEKLAKRKFDEKLCVYWNNLSPIDPVQEQLKWDSALAKGAVTYNEYRTSFLNMQAYEGFGDEPLIPSGMAPMPTGETGVEPLLNWEKPVVEEAVQPIEETAVSPVNIYPSKSLKNAAPDESIKVKLPDVRQETSFSCGASAFQSIAEMYGVGPTDESWYRDALDTDPEDGTPPENIRELADSLGLQTIAKEGMTPQDLKQWLDKGVPVMLLVQAWGDPATYATDENGHYVVAIGYTDDELIVEDPSLRLIRGYIEWADLDKRWHDVGSNGEKYDHWGMAVVKHEAVREVKSFHLNGNGKHLPKVGQEWW